MLRLHYLESDQSARDHTGDVFCSMKNGKHYFALMRSTVSRLPSLKNLISSISVEKCQYPVHSRSLCCPKGVLLSSSKVTVYLWTGSPGKDFSFPGKLLEVRPLLISFLFLFFDRPFVFVIWSGGAWWHIFYWYFSHTTEFLKQTCWYFCRLFIHLFHPPRSIVTAIPKIATF